MAKPTLISDEATIIVLGDFCPPIYHPGWFSKYDLLPSGEIENVMIEVIHKEILILEFEWFSLKVQKDRMQFDSSDSSEFDRLRDLASSILTIIPDCNPKALGINKKKDYDVLSADTWHKVGDTLAPKDIWMKALPGSKHGLMNINIESTRENDLPGSINTSLAPSRQNSGIVITVNDHYQIDDFNEPIELGDFILNHTDESFNVSDNIINTLILEATK